MSETVHYKGTLHPVQLIDNSAERTAQSILREEGYTELSWCDTYLELLSDKFYKSYYVAGERLYRVEKEEVGETDIFNSTVYPDGSIDFEVMYYNGGCSFDEALDEALQ